MQIREVLEEFDYRAFNLSEENRVSQFLIASIRGLPEGDKKYLQPFLQSLQKHERFFFDEEKKFCSLKLDKIKTREACVEKNENYEETEKFLQEKELEDETAYIAKYVRYIKEMEIFYSKLKERKEKLEEFEIEFEKRKKECEEKYYRDLAYLRILNLKEAELLHFFSLPPKDRIFIFNLIKENEKLQAECAALIREIGVFRDEINDAINNMIDQKNNRIEIRDNLLASGISEDDERVVSLNKVIEFDEKDEKVLRETLEDLLELERFVNQIAEESQKELEMAQEEVLQSEDLIDFLRKKKNINPQENFVLDIKRKIKNNRDKINESIQRIKKLKSQYDEVAIDEGEPAQKKRENILKKIRLEHEALREKQKSLQKTTKELRNIYKHARNFKPSKNKKIVQKSYSPAKKEKQEKIFEEKVKFEIQTQKKRLESLEKKPIKESQKKHFEKLINKVKQNIDDLENLVENSSQEDNMRFKEISEETSSFFVQLSKTIHNTSEMPIKKEKNKEIVNRLKTKKSASAPQKKEMRRSKENRPRS